MALPSFLDVVLVTMEGCNILRVGSTDHVCLYRIEVEIEDGPSIDDWGKRVS